MTASTETAATERPSLWRNRDFLVMWGGQIVSTLGARSSTTTLPLLVLALTNSPADAGMVGAATTLPYLITQLLAGTLVDRWNRKTIMVVSELLAGLAIVSLPIAYWLGSLTVPHIAVAAFVQGTCAVFFGLAEQAALPRVVPMSLLPSAISQNEAKNRGSALAGPPLGGLLFGVHRVLPFLADAVSSLMAAVGLLFIGRELQGERTTALRPFWREATEGLRWIWCKPFIRAAVLLIASSNLVFQAISLILIVLAQDMGASSSEIGLMFGIYGGGGLLGALAAGRLHSLFPPTTVIIGANWVWAALLPLFAIAPDPLLLGVVGGLTAFIGPIWNAVMFTYQAALVPNEMLGRVGSAVGTITAGVMPLASLGAGYLLSTIGAKGAVVVLTAIMLGTASAGTASAAVRHAPPLPADDTTK
ncbi:MFS transporter [Wenjunlia tyrosinilytica]|uniref:MFS transporter n=1 Tax=Wenjunlia tyrosinilytica TaxID=1544741 RepID=A0A918E115_9ACTN|nr:MFS transporter [Wenjunlia tyrosinilytica]GGP00186.1 MFS transporter [Wenjunlia tyrosinilytica]